MNLIKNITNHLLGRTSEKTNRLSRGMKVGKNTNIYSWSGMDGNWPWLISVGNNVTISSDVTILAHDASPCMVGCHTKLGRVTIGNNVFIGAKSIILCNTTIGNDVIVGAGSVVVSNLESGYVYAGNPAHKICSINDYAKKHQRLNNERPDLSKIRKWDDWDSSSLEEREKMISLLEDGCGYI